MLDTSFAQSNSPSDRMNGCKQHEKTIIECTVGTEKGNYRRVIHFLPHFMYNSLKVFSLNMILIFTFRLIYFNPRNIKKSFGLKRDKTVYSQYNFNHIVDWAEHQKL